jgi:hypothetical protein
MVAAGGYSARRREDLRALWITLAAIAFSGLAFGSRHLLLFQVVVPTALGLSVIRFSRQAYRDSDQTIAAWLSFYSYLRPRPNR